MSTKRIAFSNSRGCLLSIVLALALVGSARAQIVEHRLTASDGGDDDNFGYSVSLSEDRALMGAPRDDEQGTGSGSAYIFERQGDGLWVDVSKLTASDGGPEVGFGRSVSLSGDRALVGAGGGPAYVFERQSDGTWIETTKLIGSDSTSGDDIGRSVAISGDRAIATNPDDDDLGQFSGSAYIFERQGDGSWIEVAKLTASDGAAFDSFGFSASLSGERAILGAIGDTEFGEFSGSAYIFERQGDGSWEEVTKLIASDGAEGDFFGFSVSLSEEHAIVGAQLAQDKNIGSAYVFARQNDGSWIEIAKLIASDGAEGAALGTSVSFSGDRILAGARGDNDLGEDSGAAYVFENIFPVTIEPPADLPNSYSLSEPYPNPFNPQVQFSLVVAQAQQVRIEVFNTLGQRVGVLHEGLLSGRGTHRFTFDAGSLPSGVYLLRVTGETFAATRTMTLLK